MSDIDPAESLTHEHLLSVVATEMQDSAPGKVLNLLDLGCGGGNMLGYFARNLPRLAPHCQVNLYGLEVDDGGIQREGFVERARSLLASRAPEVDWTNRLFSISSEDPWPFADGNFDFIVSNQVLEHARDHRRLFGETARALVDGGRAVHLFPLRHCVYEGHLFLVWAHRIDNADLRRAYIERLSRMGLGKYPGHKRAYGMSLEEYAEMHADYLGFMTRYITEAQALSYAKQARLRASFRYTQEYYYRKLRSMLGRPAHFRYSRRRSAVADWVWVKALRYVSAVTLFLEKKQTYAHPQAEPARRLRE